VKRVGYPLHGMAVVRINIPSKATLPDQWDDIRPHFPMPAPRKFQDDALSVAWWALDNDNFDNIVIEAPTGIGKSAIAMTLQARFNSAYLLTPTLGLTEQYKRDYGHVLEEVRGRSNFPCWINSGTAHNAPCYKGGKTCPHAKKDEDDPCPYYAQKWAGQDARIALTNPAYLFRAIQFDEGWGQRDFAIIDEAHNLEPFFMDLLEVKITESDFTAVWGPKSMPFFHIPEDWIDPIQNLMDGALLKRDEARKDKNDTAEDTFSGIAQRCSTMLELLTRPTDMVMTQNNEKERTLIGKPVRVNRFAGERLEAVSRQRILLSATVLDIETYLKSLGLDHQKTLFICITKSPFKASNFNIHYAPCGPMSFSKRKHSIPRQVKAIAAIMRRYPDQRGVVLPHTHAIRKEIVEGLKAEGLGDLVLTHDSDGRARDMVIERFMKSNRKGEVLISTYVGEGFDFAGDLAHWLVLSKIPYLYTPDPQIAQRMEHDELDWRREHEGTPACPYEPPNQYSNGLCSSFSCSKPCQRWYNLQTTLKLVQGAGRIHRRPDDVGSIFILDGSWQRFYRQNGHLLPAWFRDNISEPPNWLKRHIS
jgi:ATP-dependent DNA helicase DinG